MEILDIQAQGSEYSVVFGKNLIAPNNIKTLFEKFENKKVAIITDENIEKLHLQTLEKSLEKNKINYCKMILPAGEKTKSQAQLFAIYDFLIENTITRSDCIVAFGGGVVGDLVGYAAATYLRGVGVVQIPTTLLAQVDSSVGGKVAINLPQGKNLIGTFSQPKLVICDIEVLQTLDKRQMSCGIAEIIKYGCIASRPMFETLHRGEFATKISQIVYDCCAIKANVVEQDPFDNGLRMILNFGHTIAHAIETLAGYGTYTHGEAVSIGMVQAAKWGENLGITPKTTTQKIVETCKNYSLPTTIDSNIDSDSLIKCMMGDKKTQGQQINIILLSSIGEAVIHKIEKEEFERLVKKCL